MIKILYTFFVFTLIGCTRTEFSIPVNKESKLVVEGSIEEGEFAEVLLSSSIPITETIDSTNVLNHAIRAAKITLSDGLKSEVLRVKTNKNRLPPFVYYGSEILGESGKTYSLQIKYLDRILTATTSIPKSVVLKSAEYNKVQTTDTTAYVYVKFDDPIKEKNYYQIATKIEGKESIFVPALYGNLDDVNFKSEAIEMQINRGVLLFPKTKYKPFFADGDLISVKLRTMNKDALDFWNSWQNEIVNARNPIYPSNTSLKSNINGGLGIWAGYGKSSLQVKTPAKK